jgi:anti-sigma regulatory factor (Ser/Thr protein kinase)
MLGTRKDHEIALTQTLIAAPDAVSRLRGYTQAALHQRGLDQLVEDAVLVVSELVTNTCSPSVARGREITLRLICPQPDQVLIEVTDHSRSRPEPKTPDDLDIHGRGLVIVRALSSELNYRDEDDGGKTVWALLSADPT